MPGTKETNPGIGWYSALLQIDFGHFLLQKQRTVHRQEQGVDDLSLGYF